MESYKIVWTSSQFVSLYKIIWTSKPICFIVTSIIVIFFFMTSIIVCVLWVCQLTCCTFCPCVQVCCICIANYENDDELRELPCSHLFHKDCVDKWLKINALCPLCKREVGGNETEPVIEENASQQRGESRIENSPNTSS